MATATIQTEVGFRPMVGTVLWNAGEVTKHEKVLDSIGNGRWHGLLRLVIEKAGVIDEQVVDTWTQMLLGGAVVKAIRPDEEHPGKFTILYKFEEQ